LMKRFLSLT